MAITDESGSNMVMPVGPIGGMNNNGFGDGGWWWLILLFLVFGNNGWGGGFGMDGGLYPWLNNSQNINGGFRDQMLNTTVQGIQNSITSGFGDVQLGIAGVNQNLCQTGNGIVTAINGAQNAISAQMYNNEIASLNRSFAEQTANMQGFNGVNAGLADVRYTEATEACATRTANAQNTRDIIDAQTRGTQAILDKLCQLELDGVKGQLAQAQRENIGLQNQVNMAAMQASQTAQTAQILAGQAAEIDGVYNRLKNCPVPSVPVYGSQPIFNCGGSGCGCGGTGSVA